MRIKFTQGKLIDQEYQISGLKPKGNTIVAGHAVGDNGKLREGVEDITQYTTDKDGNVVEVVPEPMEADK